MNLVFKMGEHEATFPVDRKYAANHMWALGTAGSWRFGFSAYAVRLLQDVYFLDWEVAPGMQIEQGKHIGDIESSKAESTLHAPLTGTITSINAQLLQDPSAINVDKYGDGWLFEMDARGDALLEPTAYLEHLEDVWEVTQKTIKGQFNQ